jgi:cyclin B
MASDDDRKEMYRFYRDLETQQKIDPKDLKISPAIHERIGDWMFDVCANGLDLDNTSDIFASAMTIFNHFLIHESPSVAKIGEIGAACIGIALKYERDKGNGEVLKCLAHVVESTPKMVIAWEWVILERLKFAIRFITPYHFFDYFISNLESNPKLDNTVKYMIDLITANPTRMLNYPPSMMTASAIALTKMLEGKTPAWTEDDQEITEYTLQDLNECMRQIRSILREEAMLWYDGRLGGEVSQRYERADVCKVSKIILSYYQTY